MVRGFGAQSQVIFLGKMEVSHREPQGIFSRSTGAAVLMAALFLGLPLLEAQSNNGRIEGTCEVRGTIPQKHWRDDVALLTFLRSL